MRRLRSAKARSFDATSRALAKSLKSIRAAIRLQAMVTSSGRLVWAAFKWPIAHRQGRRIAPATCPKRHLGPPRPHPEGARLRRRFSRVADLPPAQRQPPLSTRLRFSDRSWMWWPPALFEPICRNNAIAIADQKKAASPETGRPKIQVRYTLEVESDTRIDVTPQGIPRSRVGVAIARTGRAQVRTGP